MQPHIPLSNGLMQGKSPLSALKSVCSSSKVGRNFIPLPSWQVTHKTEPNRLGLNPNLFCNETIVWSMQDVASGWTGKKPNKNQVTTPLILITDDTKEETFLWYLHFCVIPCPWVNSVLTFSNGGVHKGMKSYTTDLLYNPIFCWSNEKIMLCCWWVFVKSQPLLFTNKQVLKSQ